MAEAAVKADAPLDDLMLAMDVVDTLRHSEALAEREVAGADRRARMIERLRDIYRGQGITVPDRILEEGVDALERDRFVYKPKSGGFAFTLARAYVNRGRIGRIAGVVVVVLLAAWAGWYFLVQRPASLRAEQARIELAETLPKQFDTLERDITAENPAGDVLQRAQTMLADGRRAVAAGNAAEAHRQADALTAMLAELRLVYQVRIVSRPDERSGVTRVPPNNPSVENFYLIVEAIGPDGKPIPRTITSEEDRRTETVTVWGVRVPEAEFDRVKVDKEDDGIVENAIIGEKRRGAMDVDWSIPVQNGAITHWSDQ